MTNSKGNKQQATTSNNTTKHELHQAMLLEHAERKAERRENHRRGLHRIKYPLNTLK